jgi:predicted O-methyltransferase YrrM
MWYDTLSPEDQEEVREILVHSKNTEKDPVFTRKYLELMMKTAAVFTPKGEYRRLSSHTRDVEHTEIRKALSQTKAKQTLEVGFAYGTSALVFAEHHQKMKTSGIVHTILDPNQFGTGEGHWEGIGVEALKRCGFVKGKNYRLIEDTSISALPELLSKKGTGWLDVALIDGWHLFDYTLIDVFYCLQMLRVGGVCIVDDKRMKAINAVAKYVTRAYPNIVDICASCRTMLVLRKKAEDTRDWNSDEKVNFDLK